ncbi:hypothetical protein GCM10025751_44810 [Haladaptatus pallidirubidus]|uniref:Uncharacterized protein n=1 Tax=Haladaptatus pallidirubidus TaxID=1008152 RepID=A0AAV3UMZ8_9EURY
MRWVDVQELVSEVSSESIFWTVVSQTAAAFSDISFDLSQQSLSDLIRRGKEALLEHALLGSSSETVSD